MTASIGDKSSQNHAIIVADARTVVLVQYGHVLDVTVQQHPDGVAQSPMK